MVERFIHYRCTPASMFEPDEVRDYACAPGQSPPPTGDWTCWPRWLINRPDACIACLQTRAFQDALIAAELSRD